MTDHEVIILFESPHLRQILSKAERFSSLPIKITNDCGVYSDERLPYQYHWKYKKYKNGKIKFSKYSNSNNEYIESAESMVKPWCDEVDCTWYLFCDLIQVTNRISQI